MKPPTAKALRQKYTILKSWPGKGGRPGVHIVFLQVGVQSFMVGLSYDIKSEAEWFRRMLGKALHNLISENR